MLLTFSSLLTFFTYFLSKKYTVAFNYRECEIELAAISIASYYCNDVFGKDVCNLFLKDENTFSLG